jgi:hypothetical protein
MLVNHLRMFGQFADPLPRQRQAQPLGKLLFANGALWQFSFPAAALDVLGTEVNWMRHGEYQPDPDTVMNLRRSMCRQKPYCLLMNTDFSRFTPELVERYFQRCLFYGVWPGFFDEEAASKDPYWASAKQWYERDRRLFRKFIPLLRRVTAAGWEPLTQTTCSNTNIFIERFGHNSIGDVFLTVLNDTAERQMGKLSLDLKAMGFNQRPSARELVSGDALSAFASDCPVSLRPYEAEVLCLSSRSE